MSDELKPCPWCGGEARVSEYLEREGEWSYRIDCANRSPHGACPAIVTTGYKDTLAEASLAWNTRHHESRLREEGRREGFEAARETKALRASEYFGGKSNIAYDTYEDWRAEREKK